MAGADDDYMSDAFLSPSLDVRPGVPMVRRVKESLRKEAHHNEANIRNRQKSYKEEERDKREAALQSSISSQNKGFALLQKMGYHAGQGLGKEGAGRVDPIPLNIKTDRGGIGMEQLKKRRAEENLEHYRKKMHAKEQMERKSLQDFRQRKITERDKHQSEGDLRKSQRACEQLDSQKGIKVPRDIWYWPEVKKDEDSSSDSSDNEEELTPVDKLQFITSYLRGVHYYCIWCGTTYNDEEDLKANCPGDTAADHE